MGHLTAIRAQTISGYIYQKKGGFDVVIANPPYVSTERFARTKTLAAWRKTYSCFVSRIDIYCLFYELSLKVLLRQGGVFCFISSNKFLRAGYGIKLRDMLQKESCLDNLVDFGELPVFAASTDPAIVMFRRGRPQAGHSLRAAIVKTEGELNHLREAVAKRGRYFQQVKLKKEGWTLENDAFLSLLEKVRSGKKTLGEVCNNRFYYGIKTGLNEAFVIDAETRKQLIREDPGSARLIKPWLQGREIRRWFCEPSGLHVILVHYGFHSELKRFPAILHQLKRYESQLKIRGQCQTSRGGGEKGQHHWLELDNNPSVSYLDEFEQPKVVFNDLEGTPCVSG